MDVKVAAPAASSIAITDKELLERHCPIIYLHRNEKYFPIDIIQLLAACDLPAASASATAAASTVKPSATAAPNSATPAAQTEPPTAEPESEGGGSANPAFASLIADLSRRISTKASARDPAIASELRAIVSVLTEAKGAPDVTARDKVEFDRMLRAVNALLRAADVPSDATTEPAPKRVDNSGRATAAPAPAAEPEPPLVRTAATAKPVSPQMMYERYKSATAAGEKERDRASEEVIRIGTQVLCGEQPPRAAAALKSAITTAAAAVSIAPPSGDAPLRAAPTAKSTAPPAVHTNFSAGSGLYSVPVYAYVNRHPHHYCHAGDVKSWDLVYVTVYAYNPSCCLGTCGLDGVCDPGCGSHFGDIEHVTLSVEPVHPHRLLSVYYSSHGYRDGIRIDVDVKTGRPLPPYGVDCCPVWRMEMEPHPLYPSASQHVVLYAANGGHGLYPNAGCVPRFVGFASEYTSRGGTRWTPTVVHVHNEHSPHFKPETDGWLYWLGRIGVDGPRAPLQQQWRRGEPFDRVTRALYGGRSNLNRFCCGEELVHDCCGFPHSTK